MGGRVGARAAIGEREGDREQTRGAKSGYRRESEEEGFALLRKNAQGHDAAML